MDPQREMLLRRKVEQLVATAASVYGPLAIASSAHSKPGNLRSQAIQDCVNDALLVARRIMDGALAQQRLADQLADLPPENGAPQITQQVRAP